MQLTGKKKYDSIGLSAPFNKLIKMTHIYHNLLKIIIDKKLSKSRLLSTPVVIQLEPTTKCNLKCAFCESTFWDRKGMDMPFSNFKKIIDQFPYLTRLHLQGFGEPLMAKDFFKMVEYCKSKGITVGTTTNATLLNEKNIQEIVEKGLDYLTISMDGATPEIFESIRLGSNFNEVIKNTINIIRIRCGRKIPQINFSFTATNKNIHELPDILTLAKNIGVDNIYALEALFLMDDNIRKRIGEDTIQKNIERSMYYINKTTEEAKKIGLPVIWAGKREKLLVDTNNTNISQHLDPIVCKQLFRSCYITVDGYVTPCLGNPDPRKFNFGNLLEQNFNEIWNNSHYISLREQIKEGKIPEFCKDCTIIYI